MGNKVRMLVMILVLMGLVSSVTAQPGSPPCGPVVVAPLAATAVATWVAPVTDILGNPLDPLINPVTQYNIYVDPPGCIVSGPPSAVVVAPTTSWPVPAGEHALFVTAVNIGGESPPAGPVLFSRSP